MRRVRHTSRLSPFLASLFAAERKIKAYHACIQYIDDIIDGISSDSPQYLGDISKPDLLKCATKQGPIPSLPDIKSSRRRRSVSQGPELYQSLVDEEEVSGAFKVDPKDSVWERVLDVFTSISQRKDGAAWFTYPVDPKKHHCPTYFEVIKNPMSYIVIKAKLDNKQYLHPSLVLKDILQVYKNAYTFNPSSHFAHQLALQEEKYVISRWLADFGYLTVGANYRLRQLEKMDIIAREREKKEREQREAEGIVHQPSVGVPISSSSIKGEAEDVLMHGMIGTHGVRAAAVSPNSTAISHSPSHEHLSASMGPMKVQADIASMETRKTSPVSRPVDMSLLSLDTNDLIRAFSSLELEHVLRFRTGVAENELTDNFAKVREKMQNLHQVQRSYSQFCEQRGIPMSEEFDVKELSDVAFYFLDFVLRAYLCLCDVSQGIPISNEYNRKIAKLCKII
ncbi:hypothetical protein ADUPG1_012994 [Aduncisulcus paluster]|uniref:Bromo domain-containing protein n=1 Tax=Aduncisulcus paluster TaxID=2918883 RepID=A0ABQ5K1E2_9EUKA|nr:hypothetical protein ADUPG1_012994 [Aduncisulcus paluster]